MVARLIALLSVMLVAAGCTPGERDTPRTRLVDEDSVHTISVGGSDRSYGLYVPAGLTTPAPLVVMLHGGFGSGAQAERAYGWDRLADTAKFVVAYPDGLNRAWNVNGGGCCGRSARAGVDDVAFIAAAVTDIAKLVDIDPARRYATGMSNGAIMAYTLACQTDVFAAIGPVAGTQLDACAAPHPTSVLHVHGTADQSVRYEGGPGAGVARIDGPSVAQVNTFWRDVDACAAPTTSSDGRATTTTAECADRRSVVLVTVDGGEHEWPDFATETLWRFFAAHPD